jgi:hypothetical protein
MLENVKDWPTTEVNDPHVGTKIDLESRPFYLWLPGPQYLQIFVTPAVEMLHADKDPWPSKTGVRQQLLEGFKVHISKISTYVEDGVGFAGMVPAEGAGYETPIRIMYGIREISQRAAADQKLKWGLMYLRGRGLVLRGPDRMPTFDDDGIYRGVNIHARTWSWLSEVAVGVRSHDGRIYSGPTLEEQATKILEDLNV